MIKPIILDKLFDSKETVDKADMCRCSICGWEGECSDCETEWESEGWEYPEYQTHICPVCEDGGCIDDYWYSDKLIKEMEGENEI